MQRPPARPETMLPLAQRGSNTQPPSPLARSAGCPLAQLWEALAGAAEEAGVQLAAPAVRTALWRLLQAEPGLRCAVPRWGQLGFGRPKRV